MEIKHKASHFVVAVLAGFFFMGGPIAIMTSVGEFHFLMGLLVVIGGVLSFFGVHGLLQREHDLILINQHGITQMKGNTGTSIHAEDIEIIKTYADISGRGISILLKQGEVICFDCRHYCSPKKFIKYCKMADLPCA
ncbi:MAG: hypothetical protein IPN59_16930 [Holophaga sp.]|nr:hypothetical protein [Holophaga sp.]